MSNELDSIVIRTMDDVYDHIKNGENVMIINDHPSKNGLLTKKVQYIHFHKDEFLRIVSIDTEKGWHPGTGRIYDPSRTEDFRHKVSIPVYKLHEVCRDVIESARKGATILIGRDIVSFQL